MFHTNKQVKSKNINQDNSINTTSFLKTVENTDINLTSQKEFQQKDIDEIIIKYLNLKKKLNLLWNNID